MNDPIGKVCEEVKNTSASAITKIKKSQPQRKCTGSYTKKSV